MALPVRRVEDPETPARVEDFCECLRGTEGLRWARAGFHLLPALKDLLSGCRRCNEYGVRYYNGWMHEHGIVVLGYGEGRAPKLIPWRIQAGAVEAARS